MSLTNPIVTVIGAGAVGGYYGARLAQHGHQVHFLMRGHSSAVREQGLRVRSRDGDFSLRPDQIHVHHQARTLPKSDLILVTIKTTANDQLAELVAPAVKADSAIVTMQNGLGNEQLLADHFGADRILGGMAFVCINRTAPGEIAHTDHGLIRLGEFSGGPTERTRRIAEILVASKIPCQALQDLTHGRWEKLVWNVPFNGLGALLDLTTDRLIGSPEGLNLVHRLMSEVIGTATAVGVRFPADIAQQKIEHTQTMGPYKTSTQIDRQMGRPLEVEAIFGKPLEAARNRNIATPYLEMLYNALRLLASQAIPR
jgi:2-dehydropantoate 2-reductase